MAETSSSPSHLDFFGSTQVTTGFFGVSGFSKLITNDDGNVVSVVFLKINVLSGVPQHHSFETNFCEASLLKRFPTVYCAFEQAIPSDKMRPLLTSIMEGIRKHADNSSSSESSGTDDSYNSATNTSSDSSKFFEVKSPKECSDTSDGELASNNNVEALDSKHRVIKVYVEYATEETTQITLHECKGYYTFARELAGANTGTSSSSLPHVCWPWAPSYSRAEYFTDTAVMLDPLTLSWDSFSQRLDCVIMKEKKATRGAEALARLIEFRVYRGEQLEHDLSINRSVIRGGFKCLRKILHLYTSAYQLKDPEYDGWEWLPLYPSLPIAVCFFYDVHGTEIEPPEEEPVVEEEPAVDEDGTDEEDFGEIVETGDAGVREDETKINNSPQADEAWEEFCAALVRVEYRLE